MNARRVSLLLGAVAAVLALGFVAFFAVGANQPADPSLEEEASTTVASAPQAPAGSEAPGISSEPGSASAPPSSSAPGSSSAAPASSAAPRSSAAPTSAAALTSSSASAPTLSSAPGSPSAPSSSAAPSARQAVDGFGQIAFRLSGPASSGPTASELCALLAETPAQLSKGLMGRRDLAGHDGMVFRFASDTSGPFFMRNVPVPLEIAWFGADGRFVSSADMAPCGDQEGCPLYPPAGPYRYALEVHEGGLAKLGVKQGTVLALGGGCR